MEYLKNLTKMLSFFGTTHDPQVENHRLTSKHGSYPNPTVAHNLVPSKLFKRKLVEQIGWEMSVIPWRNQDVPNLAQRHVPISSV